MGTVTVPERKVPAGRNNLLPKSPGQGLSVSRDRTSGIASQSRSSGCWGSESKVTSSSPVHPCSTADGASSSIRWSASSSAGHVDRREILHQGTAYLGIDPNLAARIPFRLVGGAAAADVVDGAGGEAHPIRAQEGNQLGHFVRAADALHRDQAGQVGEHGR